MWEREEGKKGEGKRERKREGVNEGERKGVREKIDSGRLEDHNIREKWEVKEWEIEKWEIEQKKRKK